MWQAQLRGNKTWMLSPTPECDTKCSSFSFYVEPGDAGMSTDPIQLYIKSKNFEFYQINSCLIFSVLIDTRIWYHGTKVSSGQFSLTIQSEYG